MHWYLFQFQKITQVVTEGEQRKACCSLPTTFLVSMEGAEMSVGGRQKVHQSWLVVGSGKVAQSQRSHPFYTDWILDIIKEIAVHFFSYDNVLFSFSKRVIIF